MKNLTLLLSLTIFIVNSVAAQQMFQKYSGNNIGESRTKGKFHFNKANQLFTLEGSGSVVNKDKLYFVSQPAEDDFIFSACLKFDVKAGQNSHTGLMIRSSKSENAAFMCMSVQQNGHCSLIYREGAGEHSIQKSIDAGLPGFIQIERAGDEFIVRISKDYEPLVEAARIKLKMPLSVFAGMFVSSEEEEAVSKARFWNVRLDKPAAASVDGYQSPSPSRLEILDVETGFRNVIYETDSHIEAPNWSRNGKFLIYNSSGKLYRFNLKKKIPKVLDTDFATANNNDHGISFDGKKLAISHHTEDNGKRHSIIYTVPVKGGIPKRITGNGPSYWHGWSPDDKWLTYCAERNGNYDVYKIPADGGDEIRLTTAEGLDDGPEYSPDGKYIYFNSVRSGSMEIWRMKPDGSEQVQITDDEYQNWFAHPSPDGKWLVFISYLSEVPAGSHPHNQRVMLRMIPVGGGEIKTLAFLYGGQGTINVPSWSPDSRKVAFVSYTY